MTVLNSDISWTTGTLNLTVGCTRGGCRWAGWLCC